MIKAGEVISKPEGVFEEEKTAYPSNLMSLTPCSITYSVDRALAESQMDFFIKLRQYSNMSFVVRIALMKM